MSSVQNYVAKLDIASYKLLVVLKVSFKKIINRFVQHERAATFLHILKAFFVRHSSEYETSDSDRKFMQNLYNQMRIHMVK